MQQQPDDYRKELISLCHYWHVARLVKLGANNLTAELRVIPHNRFHDTGLFLHPLKISQNLWWV